MLGTDNLSQVKEYFINLQNKICHAIEQTDNKGKFAVDNWNSKTIAQASTRVITNGGIFEHGAVNFSHVAGGMLPRTATARYPQLAGAQFSAIGISLILHPHNPYVPTTHANLRFFNADNLWWFGGGYDLTPYYPFPEDCHHWHLTAKKACDPFGPDIYNEFKQWCDRYFFLAHRNETRGIGGLFFDDLHRWDFATSFEFVRSIGNSFLNAYLPIVERRCQYPYSEQQRDFQLYRRGRYVEFNLLYDRGTLFGIQSKGRTESILVSLPPLVKWKYNWQPEPGSPEEALYQDYLRPREWLSEIKENV